MQRLVVCPGCHRHVKEQDARCPFCHDAIASPPRAGMALVGAVAVGVGLSIAACGGQTTTPDGGSDAAVDDGGPTPAYGPAPWADGAAPTDSGADVDDGGVVVMYGPPPPQDGGAD